MSYTKLLYHIIFRTKYGVPTICEQYEDKLYRYIWGFIKEKRGVLYRINGMPDHIHLFVELHPTTCIASFVKELKNATHLFLENNPEFFPDFYAWSKGYCALTYSNNEKDKIIQYIKNQKKHHQAITFENEVKTLLNDNCSIDDFFERNI
ncbi:IS200/IS605 family transposase [Avibacterium endocarditidis]|uniref:IS200/IS605 family transposase n=1 Tax=Avibacterium endocarditidis TaxID=380674 RepID=UPI0039FD16F5